jgi:NAD(P)-dependent dehydrogenase (short-subunit alcohol dehydrogenase family)
MTKQPVCVISGVGPGTGSALARRFATGGHRVAMLARNAERLAGLERELPGAKGYACDVADAAQVEAAAERIERELGAPSTLVHNAVGWSEKTGQVSVADRHGRGR